MRDLFSNPKLVLLIIGIVLFGGLFVRRILVSVLSINDSKLYKQRMKQLNFNDKKKKSQGEFIDSIVDPIMDKYLKDFEVKDRSKIETLLKEADLLDVFKSPETYIVFDLVLKAIGFVLFMILIKISMPLAILGSVMFMFGLPQTVKSTAKARKENILLGFPDAIRYIHAYLSAGDTLITAMERTIEDVDDEWKRILSKFISDFSTPGIGIDGAIGNIRKDINIMQVREFFAFIKVKNDQGGQMKEAFELQAEKIDELFETSMLKRIESRTMYAVMVQYPSIVGIMLLMSLPVIHGFMDGGLF